MSDDSTTGYFGGPLLIECPSCGGTGGPINWSWRPGAIDMGVPCPLCCESGIIEDRRKTDTITAVVNWPCARCGEPADLAHLGSEKARYTAEWIARFVTPFASTPTPGTR